MLLLGLDRLGDSEVANVGGDSDDFLLDLMGGGLAWGDQKVRDGCGLLFLFEDEDGVSFLFGERNYTEGLFPAHLIYHHHSYT